MINNDSFIVSKFADKSTYSYAEKEKTANNYSTNIKQEKAKYDDDAGKKSAKNSFGPMFKDRDHFNNMHFAWEPLTRCTMLLITMMMNYCDKYNTKLLNK